MENRRRRTPKVLWIYLHKFHKLFPWRFIALSVHEVIDFIGTITDEDTQEVVDQLCVDCMDETKKSRAAAQLSEYIRILVPE